MTILFESSNVFYAVIDGVNIKVDNPEEIERKLYQTDNRINGPVSFDAWKRIILQPSDIFQVEGFEYEVKIHCDEYHAHTKASCKIAILKLAKEDKKCVHAECDPEKYGCNREGKINYNECKYFIAKKEEPKEHIRPKNIILRESLGEIYIHDQAIRYAIYEAMEKYASQFKK